MKDKIKKAIGSAARKGMALEDICAAVGVKTYARKANVVESLGRMVESGEVLKRGEYPVLYRLSESSPSPRDRLWRALRAGGPMTVADLAETATTGLTCAYGYMIALEAAGYTAKTKKKWRVIRDQVETPDPAAIRRARLRRKQEATEAMEKVMIAASDALVKFNKALED